MKKIGTKNLQVFWSKIQTRIDHWPVCLPITMLSPTSNLTIDFFNGFVKNVEGFQKLLECIQVFKNWSDCFYNQWSSRLIMENKNKTSSNIFGLHYFAFRDLTELFGYICWRKSVVFKIFTYGYFFRRFLKSTCEKHFHNHAKKTRVLYSKISTGNILEEHFCQLKSSQWCARLLRS